MALTLKMGTSGRKASSLQMGETISGYLIGLVESKYNFGIKLLSKDAKVETLYPNGNLSYLETEIEEGNVSLNAWTVITRTGTRTSTKSRDSNNEFRQVPVFSVAQDEADIISADDASNALAGDKTALAEATADAPDSGSKFSNRKR